MSLIHYIYKLITAVMLAFTVEVSLAQTAVVRMGLRQGMTNAIVRGFTQDRQGRIWIATEGGLHRWDGFRFKVFDTENSPLQSNELNVVCADSDYIYIGTRRDGLYRLNTMTGEWKSFTREDGLLSNGITGIQPDGNHGLWITCYLRGVDYMDPKGNLTHYSYKNVKGLPDPNWCSFFDGNDKIYLGHVTKGLSVINIKNHSFVNYTDTADSWLHSTEVSSLCPDGHGHLYVGSSVGVYVFDLQTNRCVKFIPTASGVSAILRKHDGEMMFGENGKGVYALMEDRDGNIWSSNGQEGLTVQMHEKPLFEAYDTIFQPFVYNSLPLVRDVCEHDGMKYIATIDGLWVIDKQGKAIERDDINRQLDVIYSNTVRVDRQGKIWIGTFGSGLYIFNNDGKLVKHSYAEPSPDINMLEIDSKGRMWMATRAGLARFDNTDKPATTKVYGRNDGLSNSFLLAICEDRSGRIWTSGNGGISSITPDDGVIRNYTYAEGIPYHSFVERVCELKDDGRIVFGQDVGACVFYPDDVEKKSIAPHFFFADLALLKTGEENKTPEWESVPESRWNGLSFEYNENSFKIELGVQDYAQAEAAEFQFRLLGMDNKWYAVSKDRTIELHSVSPGNYELQVRASLYNGEWGEPIVMKIKVKQPWWWNNWMKMCYLLALAAVVWYLWRSYQQRLRLRRQLSERLATMYALSPQNQDNAAGIKMDVENIEAGKHKTIDEKLEENNDSTDDSHDSTNQDSADKTEKGVGEMKALDRDFIKKLDSVILDNLTEKELDIQFLTEHMFTSHSTLYRKMKSLTGMGINEYVRKHRLTRAMQMLMDGYNVTDVSEQCGFNSVNYFRRCFKNEYGMLPSEV